MEKRSPVSAWKDKLIKEFSACAASVPDLSPIFQRAIDAVTAYDILRSQSPIGGCAQSTVAFTHGIETAKKIMRQFDEENYNGEVLLETARLVARDHNQHCDCTRTYSDPFSPVALGEYLNRFPFIWVNGPIQTDGGSIVAHMIGIMRLNHQFSIWDLSGKHGLLTFRDNPNDVYSVVRSIYGTVFVPKLIGFQPR